MPAAPADLSIDARWIVPMTERGRVLENHALVVRDGRIIDLLPSRDAAQRYAAASAIKRPQHVLIPGLVNAHTHASGLMLRAAGPGVAGEFARDGVLAAIAEMLISGTTCFAYRCTFPDEAARAAGEQGMRAVVGLPVSETASPWARTAAEYLTEGLRVRDEYSGHPLISTMFAPHGAHDMSDATFARLGMLADELDAGILIDLHASPDEIGRSVAAYGARPIERLWQLGLLTPALTAVHMTHAGAADIELAQRTGMAVSLGLQAGLARGPALPPISALAASGVRKGLGSGGAACGNQDLWTEMKLCAQMLSGLHHEGEPGRSAWDALSMATRGGAAVLGLDDIGTLEPGKWADLCCLDVAGPATQSMTHPVTQLVFGGGRDIVCDVWVAGRQLLSDGEFMRMDWNRVAAHVDAWAARIDTEGDARG